MVLQFFSSLSGGMLNKFDCQFVMRRLSNCGELHTPVAELYFAAAAHSAVLLLPVLRAKWLYVCNCLPNLCHLT